MWPSPERVAQVLDSEEPMATADPREPRLFRFGVFEVDAQSGDVRKRGVRVRLQPQVLRVLEVLLTHRGQVVTRDEFRERLWPSDTFVDFDHGLNKAVNRLREVLAPYRSGRCPVSCSPTRNSPSSRPT